MAIESCFDSHFWFCGNKG